MRKASGKTVTEITALVEEGFENWHQIADDYKAELAIEKDAHLIAVQKGLKGEKERDALKAEVERLREIAFMHGCEDTEKCGLVKARETEEG